jgi:hypothetical protein
MKIATLPERTVMQCARAPRDATRSGECGAGSQSACALWLCMLALTLAIISGHVAARDGTAYVRPAISPWAAPRSAPTQAVTDAMAVENRRGAHFGREIASHAAHRIADWIVDASDNQGLPFVIIDKVDARIFVFDAGGHIQGAAPALLGSARGDDTVPGIGERELSDMTPETRTTPAGRFVAALGMDKRGEDVVWVDYDAAVSIHRVLTTRREERRLERLATPTPLDNRISYGCINVPARFYETVIRPAFVRTAGIVYVLPEVLTLSEVFGVYDSVEQVPQNSAGPTRAER